MAGPSNLTELIFWIIGGVVGFVVFYMLKVFVFSRRGANWMPGQQYEIQPRNPNRLVQREKYVDPLARLNLVYVALGTGGFIALVFAYYFITKGGMAMGN